MTALVLEKPFVLGDESPRRVALGIDVGGTGIKAGLVDCSEGRLVGERLRTETPVKATPESLMEAIHALIEPLRDKEYEVAGIGFPSVIKRGVALTAENIGETWRYADVAELFARELGHPSHVLNDADAAGLAEVRFGAGKGVQGTIVVVTLGTGIGTSLFVDGKLVPNAELARFAIRGKPAADRASNGIRKKKKLGWQEWAVDVQELLCELDHMTWPELIIIGGGASANAHRWLPFINCRATIVPARRRNSAGTIGAAMHAWERSAVSV